MRSPWHENRAKECLATIIKTIVSGLSCLFQASQNTFWLSFMGAEFDRMDTAKSGELDPKELAQSRLQVSTFAKTGK
jgi:hypothetical protein